MHEILQPGRPACPYRRDAPIEPLGEGLAQAGAIGTTEAMDGDPKFDHAAVRGEVQ